MIREYKNIYGNKITEKQATQINQYNVLLFDEITNTVKEEHHIIDNTITRIEYYKVDSENENEVYNYLKNKTNSFVICNKEFVSNFIIITYKQYAIEPNSTFLLSYKSVFKNDASEYPICTQSLDSNTLQPIHEKTKKYWYITDENGVKEVGVEFFYKNDGNLDYAIDMTPDFSNHKNWDKYTLANFQDLQDLFTINIDYYKNSNLLP
ncbi:hypothetical protein [Chryseobacterium sp. ERMR1:04]|uniref:hypothetical protein n=1 Tax=Chryseobacterium sp. ERMR1:04 TaxID=1705393 RepID=UPI0006C8C940|nr:hypothetical protein [Chryseobacterium sp. ERMR1:04]KPH15141.1 hypothetical protein AMQ68_07030 [Chryseobacterium sp. ERMR1:04]